MKKLSSGLAAVALLVSVVLLAGSTMYSSSHALPSINLSGKHNVARQSIDNEGTTSVIDSVKLFAKNKKNKDNTDLTVQLVKDGQVIATAAVSAADLSKKVTEITADFGGVKVTGDYDIVVTAEGKKGVLLVKEKSNIGGGFYANGKDTKMNMVYELVTESDKADDDKAQPEQAGEGTITVYAYRIPSEYWGPTFTGANAQMYFVLYNSTGNIVRTGFADENGYTITGLDSDEQYYIYPTDCNSCHGGDHDVVFRHWEDGSTDRPRPVNTGASVGAYYEYVS